MCCCAQLGCTAVSGPSIQRTRRVTHENDHSLSVTPTFDSHLTHNKHFPGHCHSARCICTTTGTSPDALQHAYTKSLSTVENASKAAMRCTDGLYQASLTATSGSWVHQHPSQDKSANNHLQHQQQPVPSRKVDPLAAAADWQP